MFRLSLIHICNSHWVFYAAQNGNSLNWNDNGNKERYLGVLVKNGTTEIERYNNTGSRPTNPTIKMTASQWQHVDIVYTKDATIAYLNGVRVSKVASSYSLTDILGDNGIFWIGKAAWGGGEYSSMQQMCIRDRRRYSATMSCLVEDATQHGMLLVANHARSSGMPDFTGGPSRRIFSVTSVRHFLLISSAG